MTNTRNKPTDYNEFLDELTKGDANARNFVIAFLEYAHTLDDVIDKDKPVTGERLTKDCLNMMLQCLNNPFVQATHLAISGLLVTGANAWLDSLEWEKASDPRDRAAADVLKSFYHELIWLVAYLVGGWDHLRFITTKHREFDYDFKPEPSTKD